LQNAAAKATSTVSGSNNIAVANTAGKDEPANYEVTLKDAVTLGSDADKAVAIDGTAGTMNVGKNIALDGTTGDATLGKVVVNGSTGTVNGLTNKSWDPDHYVTGQGATEDQLSQATTGLTDKGLNFGANSGTAVTNKLGSTVTVKGAGVKADTEYSGNNIKTKVSQDADGNTTIDVLMDKNLTGDTLIVGQKGEQGVAGVDGHIGINGKDGQSADITAQKGDPGVDGKDGITRIVYKDEGGNEHQGATLDDGLKFGGDSGDAIAKKLNEQLNIKGGADTTKLTDNNIGVVSENGQLNVKLAKDINLGKDGSVTINSNTYISNAGLNANSQKITNVLAGSETTDAVNYGQLKESSAASKTTVSNTDKNLTVTPNTDAPDGHTDYQVNLNKDVNLGADGSVKTGNTTMNNDGLTTTDAAGNSTSMKADGMTTTDAAGNSTSIKADGMTVEDKDGHKTSVNAGGMTITGGENGDVSLTTTGLDNGGNTITNVAAGVNGTDAVNVDQLNDTVNKAATAATTTVTGSDNITVTGEKQADGHTEYNVALNDTVKLGSGTNSVTMDGTAGTITAGTGDNAVKIDGTAGTITAGTKVSFDGTQGTGTIGNVTINGSGSTGTVNGLTNKTWEPDKFVTGQGASEDQLKALDDRTVQYDRNADGSVNKGKMTLGGDGGTTITNVKAGDVSSSSTEAVNGSQLYATNQAIINNSESINVLGGAVNKLGNRIDRVGAGAAALAALHPLDFDPDAKWDFAAGYGNYRGANAVAVGTYYRPNEDTMFSVGGSFGGGENMVNAGVTLKLGSGSNHVSTSRVAMAKELKDMRAVVAQQAEQIQQLAAMVNSLVGVQAVKPDTTTMFPDVPQNHWAYETIKAMAAQGLIEGYPDGTFGGDRTMTRYEFAQIVYRALQKGLAVDSKLVSEFKPELERIRVDTIARDKNGNPAIERVRVNK
jgi:hypothetical protein